MTNLGTQPTAEEIKAMLGLKPHPTCGFVAETYRSSLKIPANALPQAYDSNRPYGSALYFLVTPDAQIVMHRIRSDQLYHHYLGDSLEVLLLYPDGNGELVSVGSDLAAGERLDGRIMLLDAPDCRIDAYGETIRRLARLRVEGLMPGHGAFTLRGAGQILSKAASYFHRDDIGRMMHRLLEHTRWI